jgi:threonine efflux protein
MAATMGVFTGAILWALLTLAGLAALISTVAFAKMLMTGIGGLFLIGIGTNALVSAFQGSSTEFGDNLTPVIATSHSFIRGFFTCVFNPMAVLSWATLMSVALQGDAPTWVGLAATAGALALFLVGLTVYAIAFSSDWVADQFRRFQRRIDFGIGVVFCVGGLALLS